MSSDKLYTLQDIKKAYEAGFYECQDYLWHKDHDNLECTLNEHAFIHSYMNNYIKRVTNDQCG